MPRPEDLHRIVPAGIPHVKRGIVRKERSRPHKNCIAHRAQFMVPAVRTLTRYAKRGMRAIGPCDPHESRFRHGALYFDKRHLVAHKVIIRFEVALDFCKYAASLDFCF